MKTNNPEDIDIKKIKNIVFDWGGVIINLKYELSIQAFIDLGMPEMRSYFTKSMQSGPFSDLELGKITAGSIRNQIRAEFNVDFTDKAFNEAWCAMLLDTPKTRIDLLKKLSKNYDLYLLSNTNILHEELVMKNYQKEFGIDFFSFFTNVYLSHWLGMRKPNPDIFEHVLDDNCIAPQETLFIEDTEANIDTADKLGFQAFHLTPDLTIEKIFDTWLG